MKAHIVSLGCPKNLTDTEAIMGQLVTDGYQITDDPSQAELIIVNTCAFLYPAREESLSVIKEMAKWKKKGRCQKLLLAGCLPRLKNKITHLASVPEIDGTIDSIKLYPCNYPRIKATPPWYAYVKIAEGCNNKCAYCLIPKIRGPLVLRPPEDILKEVQLLGQRGVKEIVFVAQDTTAHPDFSDILTKTAQIAAIRWIRIMYTHPAHVDKKLIATIASQDKIVKYLDLPIQHACDKILFRMGRPYNRQELGDLIATLRRKVPEIALRTSVIVGFPSEGEAEFEELYDFIQRVKFEKLGVFPFWREAGTPAGKMKPPVPEKEKQERLQKLMRLGRRISQERNKKLIGRILGTIIEGENAGRIVGRSVFDAPEIDGKVFIPKTKSIKPGEICRVKITGALAHDLIGEIL